MELIPHELELLSKTLLYNNIMLKLLVWCYLY